MAVAAPQLSRDTALVRRSRDARFYSVCSRNPNQKPKSESRVRGEVCQIFGKICLGWQKAELEVSEEAGQEKM